MSRTRARRLLQAADGRAKVAILMARRGLSAPEARQELSRAGGSLRRGLQLR
ncbi:MAG: hypothetical protein HY613_07880 [Candidatus Rokubacteria bacterium]|nr:hypothetical protein [Candidatus Rokubacteria bacterium]